MNIQHKLHFWLVPNKALSEQTSKCARTFLFSELSKLRCLDLDNFNLDSWYVVGGACTGWLKMMYMDSQEVDEFEKNFNRNIFAHYGYDDDAMPLTDDLLDRLSGGAIYFWLPAGGQSGKQKNIEFWGGDISNEDLRNIAVGKSWVIVTTYYYL